MIELGDINGDSFINVDDIDAFIEVLIGGQPGPAPRYAYDDENRLARVSVLNPGVNIVTGAPQTQLLDRLTITYDALGRRIASETFDGGGVHEVEVIIEGETYLETQNLPPTRTTAVRHVYGAGVECLEEHEVCGQDSQTADCALAREFVWGPGFPNPVAFVDHTDAGDLLATGTTGGGAETFHYLKDHLGSVVALTNAAGEVVERYTYDPYGTTHTESYDPATQSFVARSASRFGNPFAWTGQRYDANVKLYHFLFRSYSPDLGRWFQRDPASYIDGPNLYQYARSAATRFMDRYGLESWAWYEGWGATWGVLFGTHGGAAAAEAWSAGADRSERNAAAAYGAMRTAGEHAAAEVAVQAMYYSGAIGDEEVGEFSPAASTVHDLTIAGDGSTAAGAAGVAGSVLSAAGAAVADVLAGNFTVEDVLNAGGDVAFFAVETALAFATGADETARACAAGSRAHSVSHARDLARKLTSEEQLAEALDGIGEPLIGAGTDKVLLEAKRLAEQYGGDPGDWVKMGGRNSSVHGAQTPSGANFEIHWYQNVLTGQVVEPKTKIAGH